MHKRSSVRSVSALALAACITVLLAMSSAVIGGPWRLATGWSHTLRRWFQPFRFVPLLWARLCQWFVMELALGTSFEEVGSYRPRPARDNEVTLVIVNHPTITETISFCHFLLTRISAFVTVFGKAELSRGLVGVVFGIGVWAIWTLEFIKRSERRNARQVIRETIVRMGAGSTFVIFADGTRPTPEKIRVLAERHAKIPWVAAGGLKHTGLLKVGGIHDQLEACRELGLKVRFVVVTVWSNPRVFGYKLTDLNRAQGSVVKCHAYELDGETLPCDEIGLKRALNEICRQMNVVVETDLAAQRIAA